MSMIEIQGSRLNIMFHLPVKKLKENHLGIEQQKYGINYTEC